MKQKNKKTIAKRIRRRPSGLVERSVVSHQHLRHRKSNRQKKATKRGTTAINPVDLSVITN